MTVLTTDFHTHILPGIDDGSPSANDSVQMLYQEYDQGIKNVFLTPHFNAHHMYPDVFLAKRQESFVILQESMDNGAFVPELILGAEVRYCPGISKWEALDQLALGSTGYILIEISPVEFTSKTCDELESIYYDRNLIPIIAHVERCLGLLNRRRLLYKLSTLPVLLQYNCSYFLEKRSRNLAFKLLNSHCVHLIGSDCHNLTWRAPCMAQARDLIRSRSNQGVVEFLSVIEKNIVNGKKPL